MVLGATVTAEVFARRIGWRSFAASPCPTATPEAKVKFKSATKSCYRLMGRHELDFQYRTRLAQRPLVARSATADFLPAPLCDELTCKWIILWHGGGFSPTWCWASCGSSGMARAGHFARNIQRCHQEGLGWTFIRLSASVGAVEFSKSECINRLARNADTAAAKASSHAAGWWSGWSDWGHSVWWEHSS